MEKFQSNNRNYRLKIGYIAASIFTLLVLAAALVLGYLNQEMFWDNFILATTAFSLLILFFVIFTILALVYVMRNRNERVDALVPTRSTKTFPYQEPGYHSLSDNDQTVAHNYGKQSKGMKATVDNSQSKGSKKGSKYHTRELIDEDAMESPRAGGLLYNGKIYDDGQKSSVDKENPQTVIREETKEDSGAYISDLDELSSGVTVELMH